MLSRSLYGQVILALVLLTITLLTQLALSRGDIQTLLGNQTAIAQSYDNVGRVYELERDVIDLQRNLLIYKETASEVSVQRFYEIIDRLITEMAGLKKESSYEKLKKYNKLIARMSGHLVDYQENFGGVVSGRKKRDVIELEIEEYLEQISAQSNLYLSDKPDELVEIKLQVSYLYRAFNQYLNNPDVDYISEFKQYSASLKKIATLSNSQSNLIPLINKLKKRFIRLTHVTRGYVYLINVVMAGSATEFLYLAGELRHQVESNKDNLMIDTQRSSKRILFNNNIEAIIAIAIILLLALFLSRRILLPIKNITAVFRVLSKGDEIDKIPGTDRTDEVGDLAKAAAVFHKNNRLTHELLEHSQDMIANQEVMNIQLKAEKDKAENAAKAKSMFLANMSHEIRTPMNGIVGLVDLVLKSDLNAKQKNYLNRIAYSGQIMMNVINDILDFSKIEAGKMTIEQVEYDINTVIENLISAMNVRINEKKLNCRVIVSKSVPKTLLGDPLRISQILLNLCSNAIKFTEQGLISIHLDYKNEYIFFKVIDTGIGMSAEQKDTIFQSFTQADGTTSRKYGGTGLGLTIVKQLIDLMDGEVSLMSEVGVGTHVNVKIKTQDTFDFPAISPLDVASNNIFYLSEREHSGEDLLHGYGLNITQLDSSTTMEKSNAPILIEASSTKFLESITVATDAAIVSGLKVGFLLQASEKQAKAYIKKQWALPVLQHPFSPSQSHAYLLNLYSDGQSLKNDDVSTTDNIDQSGQYQGHVLLVEDNEINQLVAGDMLESLGLSYDVADNGQKAVDMINSEASYDLVFMDVQMPIMDGYVATRLLREKGYNKLVICGLSANALKEDKDLAMEAGMSDYLTKPLQIVEMEQLLKQYLLGLS
jgi:signal transduction histidine kinase/CheY-like chemotaxis protein